MHETRDGVGSGQVAEWPSGRVRKCRPRRRVFTWPLLPLLLFVAPAAAQSSDAASGRTISYFAMFFRTGDVIGQTIILFLFALSLATIAYMIRLGLTYRRAAMLPPALAEQVQAMIAQQRLEAATEIAGKSDAYLARLLHGALQAAPQGYPAVERALVEVADAQVARMLRPIEYLNVIGNVAPMIGLFGTVYGMIVAFWQLVESGRPEPRELAAGISTALVTTFWGLIVAIPALAGYALIRNKVDALTSDGLMMAERMLRPLKGESQ